MGVEGKRDPLLVKLHPDVAMFAMENESDLLRKLEKTVGFVLELRDDPLLRPDEFKLVVKRAGRAGTQRYAVACPAASRSRSYCTTSRPTRPPRSSSTAGVFVAGRH